MVPGKKSHNLKGKLRFIVKNKEKPHKITSEEMDTFLKRYGKNMMKVMIFPPHRPFVSRILTDGKGRIYVIRQKSVLEQTKTVTVDIYGKDGRFLYKTELPYMPVQFSEDYFYVIDRIADDDDKVEVKKVRIKNYKKFKY